MHEGCSKSGSEIQVGQILDVNSDNSSSLSDHCSTLNTCSEQKFNFQVKLTSRVALDNQNARSELLNARGQREISCRPSESELYIITSIL